MYAQLAASKTVKSGPRGRADEPDASCSAARSAGTGPIRVTWSALSSANDQVAPYHESPRHHGGGFVLSARAPHPDQQQ
jgi:hypothetical protein